MDLNNARIAEMWQVTADLETLIARMEALQLHIPVSHAQASLDSIGNAEQHKSDEEQQYKP